MQNLEEFTSANQRSHQQYAHQAKTLRRNLNSKIRMEGSPVMMDPPSTNYRLKNASTVGSKVPIAKELPSLNLNIGNA